MTTTPKSPSWRCTNDGGNFGNQATGGVLLSAIALALVTTALGTAGTANASCASIGNVSTGPDCESAPGSVAIALGDHATATPTGGPMNLAVAVGNPGPNPFYGTVLPTKADANGTGNVSLAFGDGSNAGTLGKRNTAFVLGQGSNAFSYGGNNGTTPFAGKANTSVTVGNGSEAGASGATSSLLPSSTTRGSRTTA